MMCRGYEETVSSDMCGNVNGDLEDNVNIADLTYLVAYLFGGGAAPPCLEEGNINGDPAEAINIADLTYLVAYLFGGGPAPYDCGAFSGTPPTKMSGIVGLDATYEDSRTVVSVASPVDFRGLQIELTGELRTNPVNLANGDLEMVYSHDGDNLTFGLLDLNGGEVIPSGDHPLFSIEGEFDIESALISDMNHRELVPVIGSQRMETTPGSYALHQNYPNPFNPTTTIGFSSEEQSDYTLTIYNVVGQVVHQFSGVANAGDNNVIWDASSSGSGAYFYKLEVGSFTETRKMLLLK